MKDRLCYSSWLYKKDKPYKKRKTIYASDVTIKDADGNITKIIPVRSAKTAQKFRLRLKHNATPEEVKLLKVLRKELKPFKIKPSFQHIIHFHKQFYIIDIYLPKVKIAVEVDGQYHTIDKKQAKHDSIRNNRLAEIGIMTVRIKNSTVNNNLKDAVEAVKDAVRLRLCDISLTTKVAYIS